MTHTIESAGRFAWRAMLVLMIAVVVGLHAGVGSAPFGSVVLVAIAGELAQSEETNQ